MAVMPEAGWFGTWYELGLGVTPQGFATTDIIPNLIRTSKNVNLGIGVEGLLELLERGGQLLYKDFVSELFNRYGAARGKQLAGSKNPDYLRHLYTLHRLWPEAKFVHIIRDGRDVCLCASDRWKDKPGFKGFPFLLYEDPDRIFDDWKEDFITTTALWWEYNLRIGREFGRCVGPAQYYEMRYESLVEHPHDECVALCNFLGVPFDESMMHHEKNFTARKGPGGKILHARVGLPITSGLRNWRTEMTPSELGRFEAAAGPFLDELGYARAAGVTQSRDLQKAEAIRKLFGLITATQRTTSAATSEQRGEEPARKLVQLSEKN
jgi:hypothetical protein